MQQFVIGENEAGQRFDKFLHKYMPEASSSFFYKMLRKKNITLNGKKAEGKELLQVKDQVCFFFAEETFEKMRGMGAKKESISLREKEYERAYKELKGIQILYEDSQVLFLNKPAGILSQKATETDVSANEWMIGYLLQKGAVTQKSLETFRPSVCNRLDRNTSGFLLCGISLAGSQELSKLIGQRQIGKFYRTLVKGRITKGQHLSGYLTKEEATNQVHVVKELPKDKDGEHFSYIETAYEPLEQGKQMTYLEVELITGKTHQIRAHLASIGHPILGDSKYGDQKWNQDYGKRLQVKWQLLHAYRVTFPSLTGPLEALSNREFVAPLPAFFERILKEN